MTKEPEILYAPGTEGRTYGAFEESFDLLDRKGQIVSSATQNLPPITARVSNLADAMKQWSAAGFKLVSAEVADQRFTICQECDFIRGDSCTKCGCYMQLKSKLKGMVCPAGKW